LKSIAGTVVPVTTSMATTGRLGERALDAIRYCGSVADTRSGGDFYRLVDGDRLLWGRRISTLIAAPRHVARRISRRIRSVYPQLGTVEMAHAWSGVVGYAVHKMPQLGEIAPGVWVAGAFGGHGLNTTAMAGTLIARAIVEGDDRWRLFSPYELVWAGGGCGRLVARVLLATAQAKEAAREAMARRREITRQPGVSNGPPIRDRNLAAELTSHPAQGEASQKLGRDQDDAPTVPGKTMDASSPSQAEGSSPRSVALDHALEGARDSSAGAGVENNNGRLATPPEPPPAAPTQLVARRRPPPRSSPGGKPTVLKGHRRRGS
jgi:hypothetical protein